MQTHAHNKVQRKQDSVLLAKPVTLLAQRKLWEKKQPHSIFMANKYTLHKLSLVQAYFSHFSLLHLINPQDCIYILSIHPFQLQSFFAPTTETIWTIIN